MIFCGLEFTSMPGSITTGIEIEMREEPGEKGNSQTKIK